MRQRRIREPIYRRQTLYSVSIETPTNGQLFTAPAEIQLEDLISATTSPPWTEVVEFYANSILVATVTNGLGTNLSSVMWMNVPAGTYNLTAVAIAGNNQETSQQPVTITVNGATTNPVTNPPPPESAFGVGIIVPTAGSVFETPADIIFEVGNSGLENLVGTNPPAAEVIQFFANSNLVAEVTNALGSGLPTAAWRNAPAGTYTLVAVAALGTNQATSDPVTITINQGTSNPGANPPPPLVGTDTNLAVTFGYPSNGEVYTPPGIIGLYAIATETNADEVVQFFANSNLIAAVTNIPGSNVFVAIWTNVPVGAYNLTAVVSNSDGAMATSLPVSISVSEDTNPPVFTPFGTLASPTNGSVYAAPANVGLEETWSAWDPTASAIVQFYANSNLIATVNSGPGTNTCYAAWTNVAAGSYNLTAVLTYGSATGSSAPVSITVSDDGTNGPLPNVAARSQLPVVGVFPGNPTTGAPDSHVAGGCVYLSMAATNGMTYSLESSTDLINWSPVFTNKAVNGEAQYVAPNGYSPSQFYRIVPAKP